jgi:hypothetical protein
MKTRVALALNNLQSSDPWYSYLGDHCNEAANAVILLAISKDRKNVNLFPELRNIRWTDITVNNQGYLAKPSNLLVLDSVNCTRSSSAYDASRSTEYPLIEEPDQTRFGLLSKATTTVGYPTIYHDAASSILLWPTPTTAYLSRVLVRGIKKETALSGDSDTFAMNELWHPVVIDYATYLTANRMGWAEEAERFLTSAEKRVTQTIDLLSLGKRRNTNRVEIAGSL